MAKKFLISIFSLLTVASVYANNCTVCVEVSNDIVFSVNYYDPTGQDGKPHKGPVVIPSVSLDNHALYFGTPCDGCTLNVVDSNDVVVYTTVIPVGATSLVLPSTLSGEYELQIIQGNYCFYGPITL